MCFGSTVALRQGWLSEISAWGVTPGPWALTKGECSDAYIHLPYINVPMCSILTGCLFSLVWCASLSDTFRNIQCNWIQRKNCQHRWSSSHSMFTTLCILLWSYQRNVNYLCDCGDFVFTFGHFLTTHVSLVICRLSTIIICRLSS